MSAGQTRWTHRPDGSNWGDFGPNDQIGRMNLITPARRLAALREVKEGLAFALSLPLDFPGGEAEDAARRGPRLFAGEIAGQALFNFPITPTDITSDDGVIMSLQYSTQWDALAHWGRQFDLDGSGVEQPVYYNGYRAHEHVVGPDEAHPPHADALGIENLAVTGVQGRAVLVDLEAAYGPGRTLVGYEELMRAMDQQNVEIGEGDFLLLHTGYGDAVMAMNKSPDQTLLSRAGAEVQGADARLLEWIDRSGLVAICSDNQAVETFSRDRDPHDRRSMLPLHDLCLFKLGIHLGELWWLGDLARHLRKVGNRPFLLTAPPLRLPRRGGLSRDARRHGVTPGQVAHGAIASNQRA